MFLPWSSHFSDISDQLIESNVCKEGVGDKLVKLLSSLSIHFIFIWQFELCRNITNGETSPFTDFIVAVLSGLFCKPFSLTNIFYTFCGVSHLWRWWCFCYGGGGCGAVVVLCKWWCGDVVMKIFVEHHNSQLYLADQQEPSQPENPIKQINVQSVKWARDFVTLTIIFLGPDSGGRITQHYLLTEKKYENREKKFFMYLLVLHFFHLPLSAVGRLKDRRMTRENVKCTFYWFETVRVVV